MWGAVTLGVGVALTLLVGNGTAWTIIKVEMSPASRHLLRKWAIKCCFLFLTLLVVPGVLTIVGVIPSTPVVVAVESSATTVVFVVWFLRLGHEWRKLVIEPPVDLEWLEPWEPVTGSGDGLVRELKKELGSGHVLHGLEVVAVSNER